MKYQRGDKIVLRDDLVVGKVYDMCAWVEEMQDLLDLPYLTIDYDNYLSYYTVKETRYAISEEMISHKYEEEKRYVWYLKENDTTYFLKHKSLVKPSSTAYLEKVFRGEVEEALLTEEEARDRKSVV